MNDLDLKNIVEKLKDYLPDPNNHAKPGKAKIYRILYIPPIDILVAPQKEPAEKWRNYEVEFELVQIGRNKFEWQYKRFFNTKTNGFQLPLKHRLNII